MSYLLPGGLADQERFALLRQVRRLPWVSNFGVVLGQGQIERALLRARLERIFDDRDGLWGAAPFFQACGNAEKRLRVGPFRHAGVREETDNGGIILL